MNDEDSALAAEITRLVHEHWNGQPAQYRDALMWAIPSPTGGHIRLIVQLRRRFCTIKLDRRLTTDRRRTVARPWLESHIWPRIDAARKAGGRSADHFVPRGNPQLDVACPIDRPDLLSTVAEWVAADLTWGLPQKDPTR